LRWEKKKKPEAPAGILQRLGLPLTKNRRLKRQGVARRGRAERQGMRGRRTGTRNGIVENALLAKRGQHIEHKCEEGGNGVERFFDRTEKAIGDSLLWKNQEREKGGGGGKKKFTGR